MDQITVYGAPWCPDCRRPKAFLTEQRIPTRWVDVDEDAPAAAFVFVGLDPDTQFLRGSVDLDAQGFIRTDDGSQTSMVGLFAAGDVRAGSTKQAGGAAGEGIASLLAARRWLEGRHLVARAKTDDEPAA